VGFFSWVSMVSFIVVGVVGVFLGLYRPVVSPMS